MKQLLRLVVASTIAVCASPATSDMLPYPTQPVRIVVPFGPGGVADVTVRVVAEQLARRMGQPFVVENKPGAGGIVAAQSVTQAKPDGYTLFLISNGTAVGVSLFKSLPFDPVKDFAPVSTLAFFTLAIVVAGDSKIGSLADLIALRKSGASNLSAGTINVGSTQHLAAELFKSRTKIEYTIVPYKTSPDVITALRTKDVQLAFEILAPLLPQIHAGVVKPLAVTSERRFPGLPDVPTVAESGVRDYDVSSWNGIAAPAGTPRPVIERLNREINAIVAMPEMKQKFFELGIEARAGSPEALEALLVRDIDRWKGVVERANIEKQ